MNEPHHNWQAWAVITGVLSGIYTVARRWFATVTREELATAIEAFDKRTTAAMEATEERTDQRHTENLARFESQDKDMREVKKLIIDTNNVATDKRELMTAQIGKIQVDVAEISGTVKVLQERP